jgi:hypothetical protein
MWMSLREEFWLVSAVGGISLLTVLVAAMLVAMGAGQA